MRTVARILRSERGQSLVLTLVFMSVLIGMAAAVLDVGSWYRADRKLQANADAAALAGAQELPGSTADAEATALAYADENDGGLKSENIKFSSKYVANDTIEVVTERPAPGFFAKLFGLDSVNVRAKAVARTGAVSTGVGAAPIAVDWKHHMLNCPDQWCWGKKKADGTHVPGEATTIDFHKTGPGAFRLINIDGSYGGTGLQDIRDWITNGYSDGASVNQWYYSDPGIKPNSSHVKESLDIRTGTELLLPVYDATKAQGAGFAYRVIGFAVFHVTGYEIHGSKDSRINGYFMNMVWTGVPSSTPGNPNFGARAVALVE